MLSDNIKKYLIGLFIILFFISIFWFVSEFKDTFSKKLEINIAEAQYQSFGLIYIAEEEGYFKDENLQVNFKKFALGKDALADVIAGGSDLATVYETPFIEQVNAGQDVKIVSSLHKSRLGTGVIARRTKGINNIVDLKGKTVGAVKGTNSEYLIYSLFSTYQIDRSSVKIVFADVDTIKKEFVSGQLDAVSIFQPHLSFLQEQIPNNETMTFYSQIYVENSVLTGKEKTIQNKPEEVKRFLRALVKAEKFANDNKEKSIQDVATHLPDVPLETITKLWDNYDLTLKLDNILLEILTRENDLLFRNSTRSKSQIEQRKSIFPDYLREVDEKSVTLF